MALRRCLASSCVLACAAVTLAAAGATLWAQTTSASVSGTVTDEQAAVLRGAIVTLTSASRGTAQTVRTDDLGSFLFPYVQPDSYALRIELDGFQRVERTAMAVNANDRLSLGRLVLPLGSVAESVTVVAPTSEIQLRGGERASTLQSAALEHFGVSGRSFFFLGAMVPGVVPNTIAPAAVSAFNVNGQRANSNNVTIDGVANIDTGDNGGNLVQTNTDAIAEFKVLTSSYQAEYGRAVGGQVQVVTKSGSHEFRGSAYWYGRRGAWNANTWTNNRDGLAKETSSRDDVGYTLGGPVFVPGRFNTDRRKLFFFWNQEFQRHNDPVNAVRVTVPTELERQGDFSRSVDGNGNPYPYIRDYSTRLPCNASNTSGCFKYQGVLGRIDPGRLYAPTLAALSLFPLPNVSGQKDHNYISQKPSKQPLDQLLARGDYQSSGNWRLTGRFMRHSSRSTLPYGHQTMGSNLDIVDLETDVPGYNWLGSLVGILGNTTSLEISVGSAHNSFGYDRPGERFTRTHLQTLANGQPLPTLNTTAIQDDFIPLFTYGGGRISNPPIIATAYAPFTNFNTTYDALANLTHVAGTHTLKAGLYFQESLKDQSAATPFNGQYSFNTDVNSTYDSQHPFANAALGIYTTFTQASTYLKPEWRYTNLEWYLQDSWRTSGRLTVDLGVRFYFLTPQWDVSRLASNWLPAAFDRSRVVRLYQPSVVNGVRVGIDSATGATVPAYFIGRVVTGSGDRFNGAFQAGRGISETLTDGAKFKVSPRLGLAYDLTGVQRMIVRGGFAIMNDRPQGNQVFDLIQNPPTLQTQSLYWGLVSAVGQSGASPIYSPLALYPSEYAWNVPTVYQWNLAFQAKLPANFTLDLAYVGSRSENLLQLRNLNAVPYGAAYGQSNWDPTRGNTCSGCSPVSPTPGANALPGDFLRPYVGFGDIRMWEFGAYSNYRSLQAAVNRRFSGGVMLSAYYTWSSAKGTGGGDWDYARSDYRDAEANYGPLSFDRPRVFHADFVYQPPAVDAGKLGVLVNGWQLSGSYFWLDGTPATASYSIAGIGNVNLTGSATESARIALTGQPIGAGWSDDPYNQFNVAAFTAPQPGSVGLESPRFTMRNPPTGNLVLSIAKSFSLGGRTRFEVRLDAFNALNSVQISGVNRTLSFASLSDPTVTNLPYDSGGNLVRKNGVGTASSVLPARQLQLMTRVSY